MLKASPASSQLATYISKTIALNLGKQNMVYNWNDFRDEHPDLEVEWADGNRGRSRLSWRRRPRVLEPPSGERKNNVIVGLLIVSLAFIVAAVAFVSNDMTTNPPRLDGGDTSDKVDPDPTHAPSPFPSESKSAFPSTQPSLRSSQAPSFVNSTSPSTSISPSSAPTPFFKAPPAPTPGFECVDQAGLFYNHKGENVTCAWFDTVGSYIKKRNCGKTGIGRACLVACVDYYDCVLPVKPETEPPSEQPSVAPSANPSKDLPQSLMFTASADTTIKESSPLANLGTASWIKVDADSGVFHALIKFDLTGHVHTRPIASATLRLKAASDCPDGGYIQRTHHPNWEENAVTWSTAPGGDGTEVARLQTIKRGYWYTADITKALSTGHDHLSLRLFPISDNECMFESKENSSGSAPELNIVYAD